MLKEYKQVIFDALGGRVIVYAIGSADDVASELARRFGSGVREEDGYRYPSPAEMFLFQYNEEKKRIRTDSDSRMMSVGGVTYDLGGFFVIHAEKPMQIGILVHEIFHAVWHLAESCGIRDDEFNAHIGQYLFEEFTGQRTCITKEKQVDDPFIQPELFEEVK